MKIIASIGNSGWIIEATKNEIAKLIGHSYYRTTNCPELAIGSKIDVDSMYKRLEFWRQYPRKIKEAKEELRKILETLDKIEPVLIKASETEDKETEN